MPIVLIFLFIIVCVGILIIPFIVYRMVFAAAPKEQLVAENLPNEPQYEQYKEKSLSLIKDLKKIPYEDVWIKSDDGLKLHGAYYHVSDDATLAICFHGYKGNAIRDFCGGANLSMKMGHNLLLIDQRAHGISEGKTITFGIKERFDCKNWCDYAVSRWGNKVEILLYGISMGAATVLMASGLELPDNVKLIIADCPYSSPKKIIKKCCVDYKYPPNLCFPFIKIGGRIYGHFNIEETDAAEAVKNCEIPILIIHGLADRFVPEYMSVEVASANSKIQRETFEGAEHGMSYMIDTARYENIVKDFINKNR